MLILSNFQTYFNFGSINLEFISIFKFSKNKIHNHNHFI